MKKVFHTHLRWAFFHELMIVMLLQKLQIPFAAICSRSNPVSTGYQILQEAAPKNGGKFSQDRD